MTRMKLHPGAIVGVGCLDSLRLARVREPSVRPYSEPWRGVFAYTNGRLHDAEQAFRAANQASFALGNRDARLRTLLDGAEEEIWFRGNIERGRAELHQALGAEPLDSLDAVARPFERLVRLFSLVGEVDSARDMLAAFDARRKEVELLDDESSRRHMLGDIAIAEGRYDDAVVEYRAADEGECTVCMLPYLARACDSMGKTDSAMAVFERYLMLPSHPVSRFIEDAYSLARTHRRLAELYEANGRSEDAMRHYRLFVELWRDADPALQPQVSDARSRLARLAGLARPRTPARP
jgi:tetratricopeptide (TPR) repeat protein